MWQDDLSSSGTVGIHRTGTAAHQIDKTVQLRLGMMKTAGTGPTVGTTENRRIAVFVRNALEFIGRYFQRFIPRHIVKFIRPATVTPPI